ncbi:hypothetical protein VTO73DRAFT_2327 [Trametes versicolor]
MSSFRLVVVCTLGMLAASFLDIPTALASSQDPLNLAQFTQDGGNVVQPAFHHPSHSSPIGATSPAAPPPSQPTPQPKPQSQVRPEPRNQSPAPAHHQAHQKGQPQGEPLEASPTPAQPQSGPPYVYDPSGTYPDPSVQAWAFYYANGGMDPAGAVYFFSVPGVTDRPPVSADHPAPVPHALPTRRKGLSVFGDDDEGDEDDEDDGLTLMHHAPRKPQRDSPANQHPWEDTEIERLASLLRLAIVMVIGMALLAFKVRYNLLRPRKGDGDVALDGARAAQNNVNKEEDSTVIQKC